MKQQVWYYYIIVIHYQVKKKRQQFLIMNGYIVSVLVDFYCDRLTDRTCVPNLLEGLVALTSLDNFTGPNAVTTATR